MRPGEGCKSCRDRHIKCTKVEGSEVCLKCQETGRDCQRDSSIRFKAITSINEKTPNAKKRKRYLFHYGDDQSWVRIPRSIQFVNGEDESEESGWLDVSDSRRHTEQPDATVPADLEVLSHPSDHNAVRSDLSYQRSSESYETVLSSLQLAETSSVIHGGSRSGGFSPDVECRKDDIAVHSSPTAVFSSPGALSATGTSPLFHPFSLWPLKSREEASLLRHYVQHLAAWVDVCDQKCHFGSEVPQRAVHYPVLLYAIFALASLHRNTLLGIEDTVPEEYHNQCLQLLIPVLDDPQGVVDENFLAAVVILRSYEEMSNIDERCHLLGTTRLLNSITDFASSGGLGEAASWVCLRQDIYVALTSSTPLNIHFDNYETSRSFYESDDGSWANRMVHIFARVLNAAFRSTSDIMMEEWDRFVLECNEWNTNKPWTFTPLLDLNSSSEGGLFPMVWMLRAAHVVGLQYYCMAKIMLATCNPRIPKSGFGAFTARRNDEEAVLKNIRMIVGLAINNDHVKSASFQASHVLSACGSLLRDPREQEGAIDFLVDMERTMGWRTGHIIQSLRRQWR